MKRLAARMAATYILLAILVLVAAGALSYSVLARSFREADQAVTAELLQRAKSMAVGLCLAQSPDPDLLAISRDLKEQVPGVKVRPATVEEVLPVRDRRIGISRMTGEYFYMSFHEASDLQVFCPLHFSADPAYRSNRIDSLQRALMGAGALALAAAVVMAWLFSRTLTRPLGRLAHAAGRLAEGDWETPLPTDGPAEVHALSGSFQAMAGRLREDFQRLRADREHLRRLTAEVAHELRTPIASLRTYHELLLDGEQEDPASRQELLERSAGQVSRVEYLTRYLVDMARLEAHAVALDLVECDLAELVARAVAALQPAARLEQVELSAELTPAPVLADRNRVGQALDNLLQNALRWSPSGGRISVGMTVSGGHVSVTVADEGPGIPEELLPHVFTPFARGQGSTGMGLGLAIVRAVAHSHGGGVAAANRPGWGAVLTLTLPLHQTDDS